MQPARLFYDFVARAHVEVICVGKDYLAARLLQVAGQHSLYRSLCSHGHIYGRKYVAVGRVEHSSAGARMLFDML